MDRSHIWFIKEIVRIDLGESYGDSDQTLWINYNLK